MKRKMPGMPHKTAMRSLTCKKYWLAGLFVCLFVAGTVCLIALPAHALDINGDVTGDQSGIAPASGPANNGTVNMYSGTVTGAVRGGISTDDSATGNAVNLYGGTVTTNVFGGYASGGNANNNRVLLDGARVVGEIRGGTAISGTANNNVVTLRSGTVLNHVYAGISNGATGEARNNIVNLHQGVVLGDGLYGGAVVAGKPSTGNTLNLFGWSGDVTRVDYFQNYNFILANTATDGDTIITVTSANPSDLYDAAVTVNVMGGGSTLQVGDTITLINHTSGNLVNTNVSADGQGVQGISRLFTYDLTANNTNTVSIEVTGLRDNPQLKSLSESRVAGLGMLTQGADMLHMQGIPQLRANALGTSGPALFGVMGGQSLRYDSGSHVDVDGFNLVTGLGWNFALDEGRNGNLLVGAFFEAGWGSYDSHNSFGNAASVKGDGDTNYYGGGLLARYDTAPIGPGNLYVETSFRAGKVDTDYDSDDFYSATNEDVDFDSDATYYGMHAGLGYIWNITDAASLDLYTKYLWTHQDSDSVTIQGDRIKFKSMDSHRWQGGARFAYAVDTESGLRFTPYVGAAYEHEFDSEAKATSNGDSIDAPDVKGGTGIGELGFSFKPSATSGLSLDLGVQGYTGKREGVGGSFQIKFEF